MITNSGVEIWNLGSTVLSEIDHTGTMAQFTIVGVFMAASNRCVYCLAPIYGFNHEDTYIWRIHEAVTIITAAPPTNFGLGDRVFNYKTVYDFVFPLDVKTVRGVRFVGESTRHPSRIQYCFDEFFSPQKKVEDQIFWPEHELLSAPE